MAKLAIRNNIRRLRFDAGEMTQKDLAQMAGVTRQTIVAIEAGKFSPSLELAFRIADAFGKPLEQVFVCHRLPPLVAQHIPAPIQGILP